MCVRSLRDILIVIRDKQISLILIKNRQVALILRKKKQLSSKVCASPGKNLLGTHHSSPATFSWSHTGTLSSGESHTYTETHSANIM